MVPDAGRKLEDQKLSARNYGCTARNLNGVAGRNCSETSPA
jgi:hypothetical protein